ncbi:hypothetical protein [Streptosporangium sp. NPDC002524]|uniref:hypothetical protein n=1 Tax=Streptosporangium sp. NPDC002524 TaxID=3154537 RepID=UPI00331A65FE
MTEEWKSKGFYQWIADVLEQLSWDPARQLDYIRAAKVGADEIALQFDDAFQLVRGRVHDGSLNHEALQALLPVDAQLRSMTEEGPDLWSNEALSADQKWQELRITAERAKAEFKRALG